MRPTRRFVAAAAAATMLVTLPTRLPAQAPEPVQSADPVVAIWRVQSFDVLYYSTSVYYSCRGLQKKFSSILQAVGAHEEVIVSLRCMGGDFVNRATVRITLASPVEATPEAIQAATTFTPRQQLIARTRKVQLPSANDLTRFAAQWRSVSLSRTRGLRLEAGDCDVLHALRQQVFPHLSVRVQKERLRCTSGVGSRVAPHLEVLALLPIAPAAPAT